MSAVGALSSCSNQSDEHVLDAHMERALHYVSVKDYDRAIEQFYSVLEIDDENIRAHRGLGHIFYERGDTVSAERHYKVGMAGGDQNSIVWLGILYLEEGSHSQLSGLYPILLDLTATNVDAVKLLLSFGISSDDESIFIEVTSNITDEIVGDEDVQKLLRIGRQRGW